MEEFWSYYIDPSGQPGPNYWEYFAERLAKLANIKDNSNILDLGTYDGNVLFKAIEKMKVKGFGIGADIYYGGFKDGVVGAKQRGWETVAFVQTDANALGFSPEIFDTVLANFVGWDDCFDFDQLEFTSPDTMMSEIMRVLKPGGLVGIGAWVKQSDIEWVFAEFKRYLPEYDYDMICYAKENPEGQNIILQHAGFENIRVREETTDFISPNPATWWRQMRQAAGMNFRGISNPDLLENFKSQVFSDLQPFQHPEGIQFSKSVSFAFGTKPK